MAKSQTEPGSEIDWLAEKHFGYFTHLAAEAASRIRKADAGEWLVKLDLALDDLHAALDRAIAEGRPEALTMAVDLGFYWQFRWMASEGADRLEHALEIEGTEKSSRALGLAALSRLRLELGDENSAEVAAEEALTLARSSGDLRAEFASLIAHAGAVFLRTPTDGLAEVTEAEEIARRLGDQALLAVALAGQGAFGQIHDIERARQKLEESLELARRIGAKKTAMEALDRLVGLLSWTGNLDDALACNEEQSRIAKELGNRSAETWATSVRPQLLIATGYPREALSVAHGSVELVRQSPDPRQEAGALLAVSGAYLALGNLEDALVHAERAANIARRLRSAAASWAVLGPIQILDLMGRQAEAVETASAEVDFFRTDGAALLLSRALAEQGRAMAEAGMFVDAHSALDEAIQVEQTFAAQSSDWSYIPLYRARTFELEGRLDEAEAAYLEIASHEVPPDVGTSRTAVSRIRRRKQDAGGAAEAVLSGLEVMMRNSYRALALKALEEGAAVLGLMGRDDRAVEVLAWVDTLRGATGLAVSPKDLPMLQELKEGLGIADKPLPAVETTGELPVDLAEAVAVLGRGLREGDPR